MERDSKSAREMSYGMRQRPWAKLKSLALPRGCLRAYLNWATNSLCFSSIHPVPCLQSSPFLLFLCSIKKWNSVFKQINASSQATNQGQLLFTVWMRWTERAFTPPQLCIFPQTEWLVHKETCRSLKWILNSHKLSSVIHEGNFYVQLNRLLMDPLWEVLQSLG